MDEDVIQSSRRRSSLLHDMKKNHSGVLYLKNKKTFSVKWCVLTNVDFSYFNDKFQNVDAKRIMEIQFGLIRVFQF